MSLSVPLYRPMLVSLSLLVRGPALMLQNASFEELHVYGFQVGLLSCPHALVPSCSRALVPMPACARALRRSSSKLGLARSFSRVIVCVDVARVCS